MFVFILKHNFKKIHNHYYCNQGKVSLPKNFIKHESSILAIALLAIAFQEFIQTGLKN